MPSVTQEVPGAAEFTAATDQDGLFAVDVGHDANRVRVLSVSFHHDGAAIACSLRAVDPTNSSNFRQLLAQNAADIWFSSVVLPTTEGQAWRLEFTTSGKTGDGFLTVDYTVDQFE
jgi:hypothetical protein